MTGSDWRYVVAYWPAMVAGLFQRRDDASVAPCAATLRQSRYGAAKRKQNKKTASKRARSPSPVGGAEAIASLVAGGSDYSGGENEECRVQHPVMSGRAYNEAYEGAPVSDAVLEVVCRAAALSGSLNGDNCLPSQFMTEQAASDLAKEAYEFVTLYVSALLGHVHDSKEHRLAYHLYAALTNHGNLVDGDTSANELLHKTCKRMYQRTSKKHDDYTVQMLRAEQTLACCISEALVEQVGHRGQEEDAGLVGSDDLPDWTGGALQLPDDGDEDSGSDCDGGGLVTGQAYVDAAVLVTGQLGTADRTCRRTKGRRARVADLVAAAKGNILAGLATTLGVSDAESLVVSSSIAFSPTLEWGASLDRQRVHAADSNYGAPWYDYIRYKDVSTPSQVQHGLVRLVLLGVGNKSTRSLVVQRMEAAVSDERCVRTRFGFRRLKWVMDDGAGVPSLAVVSLSDVLRLEQVEPDFVPFTERHGLFVKPTMPDTPREWRERRFFTNPFHPWTSAPVMGH